MNYMIDLLKKFETLTLFPFYLCNTSTIISPSSDIGKELPLAKDPSLLHTLLSQDGFVYEVGNHDIFYYVSHYSNQTTIIAGPLSPLGNQKDLQQKYSQCHHLSNKFGYPVKRATPQQIICAFELLNTLLDKCAIKSMTLLDNSAAMTTSSAREISVQTNELQEYMLEDNQYIFQSTPYLLEKQMLEALQTGDERTFYFILEQIGNYQQGQYASTSVKTMEYAAIMLISSFTRAVVDAGVPARDAYALSDMLCSKVSRSISLQQLETLIQDIYDQYFSLIKKKKSYENTSPYIPKCTSFILRNLNQNLSPDIVAKSLGISKDYLMHIFPQYLHCTVMDYIYRSRIDMACNMLKFSDYSIGRIATYFQFKTQSHFSVIFKKYKGMSPVEYRKMNKPQDFR